jgi:hypothetical protein
MPADPGTTKDRPVTPEVAGSSPVAPLKSRAAPEPGSQDFEVSVISYSRADSLA